MRRSFRLATVERLRAAGLEQATRELGAARSGLAQAQQAVTDKQDEILACVPDLRSGPMSVTALAHRRDLLREQADQLAAQAETARLRLAASLADWQQARSRLEAVEVLHERHRQAVTDHDLRQEQRLTDDLAVVSTFPRPRRSHRPDPHRSDPPRTEVHRSDPFLPDPTGGDAA